MTTKLHKVTSLSHYAAKPIHLVHLAAINNVIYADGLHGQVAMTKCGKAIVWFTDVTDSSGFYTDGTPYERMCPACQKAEQVTK